MSSCLTSFGICICIQNQTESRLFRLHFALTPSSNEMRTIFYGIIALLLHLSLRTPSWLVPPEKLVSGRTNRESTVLAIFGFFWLSPFFSFRFRSFGDVCGNLMGRVMSNNKVPISPALHLDWEPIEGQSERIIKKDLTSCLYYLPIYPKWLQLST